MVDHNHVAQGDTTGCPACDQVAGRLTQQPAPVEDHDPQTPWYVAALAEGTHRIVDERAVCDGGGDSRCHWWPDSDVCDHETFPCGHEYVYHDDCWIIQWIDAAGLGDTATDETHDARVNDGDNLRWPNGTIDYEFDGDYLIWWYLTIDGEPSTPVDGRRASDIPLWDDERAPIA